MREVTRRDFLHWSALGGAGLLLPSIVRPKPRPVVFDMGRQSVIKTPDMFRWWGEWKFPGGEVVKIRGYTDRYGSIIFNSEELPQTLRPGETFTVTLNGFEFSDC